MEYEQLVVEGLADDVIPARRRMANQPHLRELEDRGAVPVSYVAGQQFNPSASNEHNHVLFEFYLGEYVTWRLYITELRLTAYVLQNNPIFIKHHPVRRGLWQVYFVHPLIVQYH